MFCIYNVTGGTYKTVRGTWTAEPLMGYKTESAAKAQLKKEQRQTPTLHFEIHEIKTKRIK